MTITAVWDRAEQTSPGNGAWIGTIDDVDDSEVPIVNTAKGIAAGSRTSSTGADGDEPGLREHGRVSPAAGRAPSRDQLEGTADPFGDALDYITGNGTVATLRTQKGSARSRAGRGRSATPNRA